jgi:hypothetical protein
MPAQDSEGGKPASTSETRLVEPAPAAETTQPSQVLMQRVIALSGVVEISNKAARQPVLPAPVAAPKVMHNEPVDLSKTSLEWGGRQIGAAAAKAQVEALQSASASTANNADDNVDAEWATHSSIALELCDDSLLSSRALSLNIEDAVTQQYNPNAATDLFPGGSNEHELVTKLREPNPAPAAPREAARAPRMLVVPAGIAWTVAGAFSVCALALAYLVTAFLACGHPSLLDPLALRCVDRADVAKAR